MSRPKDGMIRITFDVKPEVNQAVKEIAEKERWSRRKVAIVAVEYYLKLRGVWPNEGNK